MKMLMLNRLNPLLDLKVKIKIIRIYLFILLFNKKKKLTGQKSQKMTKISKLIDKIVYSLTKNHDIEFQK